VRDTLRTTPLALLTLLALALLGCNQTTTIHGLGAVRPAQLCPDLKRCDARGDTAVSTVRGFKARPIYLADGQGPESFLGKVAPDRKAEGALMTCGGDVTKDDWHETAPTLRTLELDEQGKKELRTALRTHFAEALHVNQKVLEGTDATPEAAIEAAALWLNVKKVGLVSQTYWLKDAAFERRVSQCGDEHYENIIYSVTVLRLSDLMHKELELRLVDGLDARLTNRLPLVPPPLAPAPASDPAASHEVATPPSTPTQAARSPIAEAAAIEDARYTLMQELAYRAVHALAGELRVVAAFGYDEP
jgi:hypothetical protein